MSTNNQAAFGTGVDTSRTLGANWGRTSVVGAVSTNSNCQVLPVTNTYGSGPSFDAATLGNLLVYGPQLEAVGAGERAEASSYIPTTSGAFGFWLQHG